MRHVLIIALIECLFVTGLLPTSTSAQTLDDAKRLNNEALRLYEQGKYSEALPFAKKALEICEHVLDPDNLEIIVSLNNLGLLYLETSQYEKAEQSYERAKDIERKTLGEDSPAYATTLNNLGSLYRKTGKYEKALPLLLQSVQIRKKVLGPDNASYATSLYNLSLLYQDLGQFEKAEPLCIETSEIKRKTRGENHPEYAVSLENLAGLYDSMGERKKAEPLFVRANDIVKKTLGENHPEYATTLNNLGLLYVETGQYEKAESLYIQANEIKKKTRGENSTEYATGLNNLANLYREIGQFDKAEPLFVQAANIFRNTLGEDHFSYAESLNNLATLYVDMGKTDKAARLYLQSLDVLKKTLGENHPAYASNLSNLADLYERAGRYSEAEALFKYAIQIDQKTIGPDHPDYAIHLNNLASLYHRTKQYDKEEPLLIQTREIISRSLGENHPEYAISLDNLNSLYAATDRTDKAVAVLTEAMQIEQGNIRRVFGFSSESDMRAYLSTVERSLSELISLSAERKSSVDTDSALDWVLRRKAMILDALIQFKETERLFQRDPQFAGKRARYLFVNQQLSNLPLRHNGMTDSEFQQKMVALRQERDRLQADLNRTLSANLPERSDDVDATAVRQKLKSGSAMIEFVRSGIFDFKAAGDQPNWKPAHYFAFVLTAANSPTQMIDLGDAAEIDQAIKHVRSDIIDFGEKWKADTSGILNEAEYEKQYRVSARHLFDLVFAPLGQSLGKAKMIYVAADSQLNLVSFDALVGADDQYLIEKGYSFAYLSSGRDLLRQSSNTSCGTVVFADPDFDMSSADRTQKVSQMIAEAKKSTGDESNSLRAFTSELSNKTRGANQTRSGRWDRLNATLKEAKDVQQELASTKYGPVKMYTGNQALEDVFKRIQSPRVLHISTHGFFPEDSVENTNSQTANNSRGGSAAILGQKILQSAAIDNPLLSTGLVLAGANTIGESASTGSVDDGWVTAEEISMMQLQGTELVVLSACGSGLGTVSSGEGVYGLRRAFQNTGAKTIVSTLFEVPDKESEQIMRSFYEGIKTGKGKLDSLRDAELKMIRNRRKTEGATHPYFWASFVLAGDPK